MYIVLFSESLTQLRHSVFSQTKLFGIVMWFDCSIYNFNRQEDSLKQLPEPHWYCTDGYINPCPIVCLGSLLKQLYLIMIDFCLTLSTTSEMCCRMRPINQTLFLRVAFSLWFGQ